MNQARSQRIVMDGNGSYLGMSKGCFVLKDRNGNEEKYPLFENEIKEVVLRSGNSISTGARARAVIPLVVDEDEGCHG